MKKAIFFICAMIFIGSVQAQEKQPEPLCEVQICNKIERLSLDVFTLINDRAGKVCFDTMLPKSEAVQGAVLKSESRWWQGSTINPTKKSVTRITEVYSCNE